MQKLLCTSTQRGDIPLQRRADVLSGLGGNRIRGGAGAGSRFADSSSLAWLPALPMARAGLCADSNCHLLRRHRRTPHGRCESLTGHERSSMVFGWKRYGIAFAAGLAILLVGCGSSHASSGSSSSSAGSNAQGSSPSTVAGHTPIKVGSICTCSGTFGAAFLPGNQAYKAFMKTVNASGGINGHPVDLIVKDDAGNPSAAVTAFQALRSDGVVAIEEDDLVDQAWSSRAAAAEIPVIGGLVGTQTQGALKFPAGSTDDVQLAQTVNLAKEAGTNKIGDLYCAESPTCAQGYAALK